MNKNYYIKSDYIINSKEHVIEKKKYWSSSKISQSYYTQYSVYEIGRKVIQNQKIKSVLDIGCGPATNLMNIIYPLCSEVYGVDNGIIIYYCKKRYNLNHFFNINLELSDINLNKQFDLIISADVVEHLKNPDKLLLFIKRHSHKDTIILISTPERDILRGKDCQKSPKNAHVREWNKREFYNYIRNSGFHIIKHQIVQSFRLLLNLRSTPRLIINDLITQIFKIGYLKKPNKINHTQLIVCKLNTSEKKMDNNQLTIRNNFLNRIGEKFLIILDLILFKILDPIYRKKNF